jgi:hypothetical protein
MRRLAKFTIRRQQSQEVDRENLIFPQNCDIIIIQSKEKITYKYQDIGVSPSGQKIFLTQISVSIVVVFYFINEER